ncbi:hypothetical protein MITS9504_03382 [Synechococcus sp. MIT S9504]|nr:hypothetical protein MITS9504_03382 [Synechococcus sp. MIT S9504]
MAIKDVENGDGEAGIGEGDGLVAEIADAARGVSGVQISGCTAECVDGGGIDGTGGASIEGVKNRDGEAGIGEGDGLIAEIADAA